MLIRMYNIIITQESSEKIPRICQRLLRVNYYAPSRCKNSFNSFPHVYESSNHWRLVRYNRGHAILFININNYTMSLKRENQSTVILILWRITILWQICGDFSDTCLMLLYCYKYYWTRNDWPLYETAFRRPDWGWV